MITAETLPQLRARHHREEAAILRAALASEAWLLLPAARRLGVALSSLQRVIARHPEIDAERQRRGQLHGRPSAAERAARVAGDARTA